MSGGNPEFFQIAKAEIMTNRSVVHASFTITRVWKASPARVFQAFASKEAKDKWFAGPPGWTLLKSEFDFREGGREHLAGRHANGMVSVFDCFYQDIVPNGRIIYSYVMHLDDRKISVSQAAIELKSEGGGTKLVLTEYCDYLDGYDDAGSREHGTNLLMDALGKSLAD
jgi:uncharacterized protein YndB with AHSA1/START domain